MHDSCTLLLLSACLTVPLCLLTKKGGTMIQDFVLLRSKKMDVSMRAPVPVLQGTPDTHSTHDSDSEEGLTTSNVTQFAHSGSYTGAS